MSKINKVVVKGVSYDVEDAQAREDIENMVTEVTWGQSNNIDDYIEAGVYDIAGTRWHNDGLPINNMGENATIAAKLFVTVTPEGATTYRHSIGQTLILTNAEGKETKVYTRNGNRTSTDGGVSYTITWADWSNLQTNINVNRVEDLDELIDNGIYSGVWLRGTDYMTFVCVVINDYALSSSPRRVSQFIYGLNKASGNVVYLTRIGEGDTNIVWGSPRIINEDKISEMISDEIKKVTDGVDPEKLDSLKDLIAWVDTHGGEVAGIKSDIQANEAAIEMETERAMEAEKKLEEKIAKEKTALVNGDTIVGLAREVYSRQGKVDTATFLKRTTAGGTSISDGVATLRQIGGNTVKNLVDGTFGSSWRSMSNSAIAMNGCVAEVSSLSSYGGIVVNVEFVVSHTYYCKVLANPLNTSVYIRMFGVETPPVNGGWQLLSLCSSMNGGGNSLSIRGNTEGNFYLLYPLLLDLTEMFGAGNEPTKEECDKIFGTMDVLPQGLTIAQPTGLKSTGYNQWNPNDVLADKTVTDNALATLEGSNIAVVECLPCKTGAGENNGYVIGYGEGDTWSDENVEVYLSPFNPIEVEGKLYMHKLEKDETYSTYIPQIKGYLLVVTPITDRLCVNFLWSEDRARTDYEEYIESYVTLPAIPEMSEYGLAGIQSSGSLACDVIDLESCRYIKRIERTELWLMSWRIENITLSSTGESYRTFVSSLLKDMKFRGYNIMQNAIIGNYTNKITFALSEEELLDKQFMVNSTGNLFIRNDSYESLDVFKNSLDGQYVYYEIDEPLEYPILVKSAPNYIGSDYGVEEFTGSKVPLVANILFYMRSLVSETRNFLDRLMARLGISDATAVADKIADAIIPTTEGVDIEPTEVIEE